MGEISIGIYIGIGTIHLGYIFHQGDYVCINTYLSSTHIPLASKFLVTSHECQSCRPLPMWARHVGPSAKYQATAWLTTPASAMK